MMANNEKLSVKTLLVADIAQLPKTAGVYFLYEDKELIYIGKAVNLQERVRNHFHQPSPRNHLFIERVSAVGWLETDSEIEALVLEAKLIKQSFPKFNVMWRDDKNYFFIEVSKSKIPCICITHQKENSNALYIGPFIEGNALKKTLKILRRIFPFYTSPRHPKGKCGWCHLGLCPGPSPDLVEYRKNIKKILLILEGKRNAVLHSLKKEMAEFSRRKDFERAAKARDKIAALEQVMAHAKVLERTEPAHHWQNTAAILRGLLGLPEGAPLMRIECYDISNIQGKQAVGAMAVFTDGAPDRSQYRKFRIRMENEPNDIAMIKEVLERRLNNLQWPYPQVMLIDGGIAQCNAAVRVKNAHKKAKPIKVISLAKRDTLLFIEERSQPVRLKSLPQALCNLIIYLDDEAHRFAITYHKLVRKKHLLPEKSGAVRKATRLS